MTSHNTVAGSPSTSFQASGKGRAERGNASTFNPGFYLACGSRCTRNRLVGTGPAIRPDSLDLAMGEELQEDHGFAGDEAQDGQDVAPADQFPAPTEPGEPEGETQEA